MSVELVDPSDLLVVRSGWRSPTGGLTRTPGHHPRDAHPLVLEELVR